MTELTISRRAPRNSSVVLLGWALALGVLSYLVAQGALVPLDMQVAGWMAAVRSPALDGSMQTLTWFGSSTWAVVGLFGLGVWAWRRGGNVAALPLIVTFLAGVLLQVVLRLWVSQWRPDVGAIPASMDWRTHFELAGFPSGHAFRSAFIFGWLAVEARGRPRAGWWRALCLVMTALVGFTRVYLNRHWATDVAGAWLVVLTTRAMAYWWEERRSA